MAVGCLHRQWSVSNVPRATVSYPIVVLEGQGCGDLASLPIATVNVMATNDNGRNWCMDHSHGERGSGIWQYSCARVRACQMSSWLRRHSNVFPSSPK